MNDASAKILVKGLVQGVGYRYYTQKIAAKLGLKGYVKNLWDGDVEVVAEGDKGIIEELIDHLKIGPRSGRVTNVFITWDSYSGKYSSFDITF